MSQVPGPPGMSDAVQPAPLVTAFPTVDTFTIANIPMPGRWTLLEAARKFGWQIRKGYALSGAQVFHIGDELVVARFRGEFFSSSDFAIWKQVRKQIYRKPVFAPPGGGVLFTAAMGIDHPELKALGVNNVVTLEVHAARQEEGGLWSQHIDFLEYYPPIPAVKRPVVTIPDVAAPTPTAKNMFDLEIQKAEAQIAFLGGK